MKPTNQRRLTDLCLLRAHEHKQAWIRRATARLMHEALGRRAETAHGCHHRACSITSHFATATMHVGAAASRLTPPESRQTDVVSLPARPRPPARSLPTLRMNEFRQVASRGTMTVTYYIVTVIYIYVCNVIYIYVTSYIYIYVCVCNGIREGGR
jgi:hypothetical protein